MNLNALQLQTALLDGTVKTIRLANLVDPVLGFNLINAPLAVKAELGAQYKLVNIETGVHQKGQRLIRNNKNLKIFLDDEPAIEIQDYFVASLTPVENSAVYRLENESCNEVQVISHYPPETFEVTESLPWTEGDSALDCKVALYNPGSFIGLIPSATAAVPTTLGLGEIAATAIAIPVFTGGKGSTPVTASLATITSSEITRATGSLSSLIGANIHWLNADDGLFVSVTFSEAVFLNTSLGSPTLSLLIGTSTVQANYVSGSGSNTLVFATTIANGQNDNTGVGIGLNALNLNGGTLKDANGNNVNITSAAVADNANYLVDTTRPTVAVTSDTATLISNQTATITSARVKPVLVIDKIPNQDVKSIGEAITIPGVYGPSQTYILPVTLTPSVCFASFLFAKIISGGTCKLTYQSPESATLQASDLYTVSFEILKDGQPVVAPAPVVTPTPTPKPVVKKTITCTKGTKSVKRTGVSPKCPKGFKLKR